jgi:integrase/recombinase XerD
VAVSGLLLPAPATDDHAPVEIWSGGHRFVPPQATSDTGIVEIWLGNYRSPATRRRYASDAALFLAFVAKPLGRVTVGDIQAFAGRDRGCSSPATVAARLTGVKSLIAFAHRVGYIPFDPAATVQLPAVRDTLATRIISESDVQRIFGLERDPRNAAILRLLYASGLRISELCSLKWADLTPRDEGGQLTVMGKGGKTRSVLLPSSIWQRLLDLRSGLDASAPVFPSRKGGSLRPRQVHDIVKSACARAKLPAASAHWFRHSHASHSLDHGCPPHIVQATLGHASLATTSRYVHVRPGDSSSRYVTA